MRKFGIKTLKNLFKSAKLELALLTRLDPTLKLSARARLEPAKGRLEPIPRKL